MRLNRRLELRALSYKRGVALLVEATRRVGEFGFDLVEAARHRRQALRQRVSLESQLECGSRLFSFARLLAGCGLLLFLERGGRALIELIDATCRID